MVKASHLTIGIDAVHISPIKFARAVAVDGKKQ